MDMMRVVELISGLRGFGFDISLRQFNDFVDAQDEGRQAWLATASKFDVLDWLAEALRAEGFDA
ncbi:MAG: hypothetical protein KJ698_01345 [Actinobacteria bacterium]|nr:hypothetical protein [Actinomycetota bacterium]MBU1493054.1 hypothetical protein [Actinomycetota bacterium]